MYHPHPPSPAESLPTMYDLPSENPEEPGLPDVGVSPSRDVFHDFQPQLLRETCQPTTYPVSEVFIGTDLNLYYDGRHPQWYKRPDWFLVLGVTAANRQEDLRWSYVVWQESVNPFLVIELLSAGTETEDLGQTLRDANKPPTKWQVYEQILRVPYYAIFDRYSNQFRLFCLQATHYKELDLTDQRFWFTDLGLGLGVWSGSYQDIQGQWLRWYNQADNWIPTEAEARRAAIPRLATLGLTPVEIAEILLLPLTEVERYLL